ncbi:YbhB/YbcL family Raf kinase inhibitor-like protein [bacterium]|nr:YbhB/YbcL family Raf kinase inhibitor-like protein [bacterium]
MARVIGQMALAALLAAFVVALCGCPSRRTAPGLETPAATVNTAAPTPTEEAPAATVNAATATPAEGAPTPEAKKTTPASVAKEAAPGLWRLSSEALASGVKIPAKYTEDGENVSPPLSWGKPPAGTRELALICDDPDAPGGTWTHWIAYGIKPETTSLPEALPADRELKTPAMKQGANSFGKTGYGGPAPPAGKAHRYQFTLYALKAPLKLGGGASKDKLLAAMKGQILATTMLEGTYSR